MNQTETVTENRASGRAGVIASFIFAYVLTVVLVCYALIKAGVMEVLAFTRLLNPLIEGGLIKYHDLSMGVVEGIGKSKHYLYAQQPISWWLVGVCAATYFVFYMLKAVQFHSIARFYGLKGGLGQHTRAYFYGLGLNRFLPFSAGDVGTVAVLEGQDEPGKQSASALNSQEKFVWFEIAVFFLIGVVLTGWSVSILQIVPAVLFFAALYFIMRPGRRQNAGVAENQGVLSVFRTYANQPLLLVQLAVLSLLAFFCDDITPYIMSQAFTSGPVLLNTSFLLIQGAVIAGYIASRVPITPGAIGQFEFGFAMALYIVGADLNVAVTIAMLDGFVRHGVAFVLFLVVRLGYGVETNLRQVLARFAAQPA